MKIGYICADVDIPILGHEGCSVKIREFTDALIETGHEVFILCSWLGESNTPIDMKASVHPITPQDIDAVAWSSLEIEEAVQNNHLERDLKSLMINYWLKLEGAKLIREQRPDLIYECYSLFGYAGTQLAQRFGIPLILEVNAPLVQEQTGYIKFPFSRTAERLEAEIFRRADVVVGVSDWVREFAVSRGADPARVHAVPNGVGDHFCTPVSGEEVRRRHDLVGKRVIGFVGSFQWWHDVEGLLAAAAPLIRADGAIRMLLVGHGSNRQRCEDTARALGLTNQVVFTGNVGHELIPQYIRAMDVAVAPFRVPSGDEIYFSPMKLFEYMAVGTASVGTRFGQIADNIEQGVNGWLYEQGDVAALTEVLRTLLYTPGLAEKVGAAARKKIIDRISWQAVAPRILELAQGRTRER